VLHFNVTEHPTAAWTALQIVEAFEDRDAARYLLRDRDSIYGNDVRLRIASLGTKEILTAPRSPWQNPYAERLIGSIRRECLNHFVILNAKHLKRTLKSYFRYYHESRTLIWDWPSSVQFLGRYRVEGESSKFRNSVGYITAMNALQCNAMATDAIVAKHRTSNPIPSFAGTARDSASSGAGSPGLWADRKSPRICADSSARWPQRIPPGERNASPMN
jgi:hypothetical protein